MFFKKKKEDKKYNAIIDEGVQLRKQGKFDEAIEKYHEAFKIKVLAFDYIALCFMEIDNKNYLKAIEMINKLLENEPSLDGMSDCYFGLGAAYYELGNNEDALKYFNIAIEKGCTLSECYYLCGNIYDELGLSIESEETQKAIEYYQKVVEKVPSHIYAYVNIGTIYEHNDKNEEALSYFLKAYELDKNKESNACYNLGVTYAKLKDFDNAIKYYKEDLAQPYPAYPTAGNLALLYQTELHQYEEAKKYYLIALEKDKEDYNAWYNLGCLYCNMGDFQNAYDCFKVIKYKKPDFVKGMEHDKDLVDFIKTPYYEKIIKDLIILEEA